MDKIIDNKEWVDYPFNPTVLSVRCDGSIKRKEQVVVREKRGNYIIKEMVLKTNPNKRTGYIHLTIKGEKENLAHRIVALTYIPNPLNLPQVHHKNHIRHDNRVDNLEWTDNSGNQLYSFKEGYGNNKGDAHPNKKITQLIANEIREKHKEGKYTLKDLATQYNISSTNVSDIIKNKIWNYDVFFPIRKKKIHTRLEAPVDLYGEIWFNIPNIPNYQISNLDRIKSLQRTVDRPATQKLIVSEKVLKLNKSKHGHLCVSVSPKKGGKTMLYFYKVKAIVFLPNPDNYPCVKHIDGDYSNNDLSNLKWCTDSEIGKQSYSLGRNVARKGVLHHKAILNEDKVRQIRKEYKPREVSYGKLAKKFGVAVPTIKDIITGRRWKHIL